jgi:hypothetical protein
MSQKVGLEYGVKFLNRLVFDLLDLLSGLFQRLAPSRSSRLCGGKVRPLDLVGRPLPDALFPRCTCSSRFYLKCDCIQTWLVKLLNIFLRGA